MQRFDLQQITAMKGQPLYASDGKKLGSVDEILVDTATGEPEWIGTSMGLISKQYRLVPLAGARVQGDPDPAIYVPYGEDQVKAAPDVSEGDLPEDEEERLYAHYGLEPSEQRSETQLPEGERPMERPATGMPTETAGEASMARHEEEMRVGRRETERGRVRLRKWVETEPVAEETTLRRETAHVEREQVDRPAPGAEMGEEEAEMTLHEEEPVVSKETYERERVTLEPEEETREETVRGDVRKEHVEVEGEEEEEPDEEWRRKAG